MDYKSYKAMCDSTLQQIRESENKREELNNKLQKMYQEKSECEKSIIKTLQSQQKQFMDEKRRRAERNENILRTLERVDYQAQMLASKTERLRALKRQYERYLLSLWTTRKAAETASVYSLPQNHLKIIGTIQRPYTAKYDESPAHQSSYYMSKASAFVTDLRPSNYLLNAPSYISMSSTSPITTHTYQNNQSHYREVPLTSPAIAENSIMSGNYRRGVATIQAPAVELETYPSYPQMVRYDFTTSQIPSMAPPFSHPLSMTNENKKSNDNAINNGDMNQPTTINSIYSHMDLQRQNQQQQQQQQQLKQVPQLPLDEKSSLSIYQRNNHPQEYHHNYNSEGNMKMSKSYHDNPLIMTTSAGAVSTDFMPQHEKVPVSFENRLNNDSQHDNTIHMSDVDSDESETFAYSKKSTTNILDNIKFSDANVQSNTAIGSTDVEKSNNEKAKTTVIVAVAPSDDENNMHQVWEKLIEAEAPPLGNVQHSSFVIPKIIVETQIDLTEAPTKTETTEQESLDVDEKQDRDIPEKLLKHSSDNRENESYDNLASTEQDMTIYHPDQQSLSTVDYELRNFDDIKISDTSTPNIITHESDMMGNNSLTDGSTEAINNINDDKNQKSSSLNDKISEIYRKIEKIEGEYYGEKGKIMENFEMRRMSAASLSDEAKIELTQSTNDEISSLKQQEFNLNTNEHVMDKKQHIDDDDVDVNVDIDKNEWKSNQSEYAEDTDGNQKNFYDSQLDSQSNYNYYQQQNQNINEIGEVQQNESNFYQQPSDYLENSQTYEQNQQPVFENQEYVIPAASFEDENINNDNNNSAGEHQTTSVEQYSYEPSTSSMQYQQSAQEHQEPQMYQNEPDPYEQQQYENQYDPQQSIPLQQTEIDANNFYNNQQNQEPQSESNYQQSNYDEAPVDRSNYANDAVYYDYGNTQNQNYSSDGIATDVPQTMYDDQNYPHQMTQEYEGVSPNLNISYQNDDEGNMYQDHSNENNYNGTDSNSRQDEFIETSNGMNVASYDDTNEYQSTDGSYANTTELYRTETKALENANYETQHLAQPLSSEHFEQIAQPYTESTVTTDSSDVSSSKAHEMIEDRGETSTTKRDDIKLVKQLLDSESSISDDPNSNRSNLLKTAIKEEDVDESDFDFSTN